MFDSPTILETNWRGILDGVVKKIQLIKLESISKHSRYSKLKSSFSSQESVWIDFITNRENMNIPTDWYES